jgi:hypothetical protein
VTEFAQRTIDLARRNVAEGGRPFATVIIRDGEVLAESANRVAQTSERSGGRRKSTVVPPGRADDIVAPPTASLMSAYACR